jgi:hypothetical protein
VKSNKLVDFPTYQELTAMPAPVYLALDVRAVEFCVIPELLQVLLRILF